MAATLVSRSCEPCRSFLRSPRWSLARFQQTLTSAYVFHPNIETTEADKQMMMWTKSVSVVDPPAAFSKVMEEVDLEPIGRIMQTTVLASRLYEKREIRKKNKNNPKDVTRGTHSNFPFSLLQNQFKNVMGFAKDYPQLWHLNPAPELRVSASWQVLDEMLSVHGKPGMFLNSKRPMPHFYNQETVEKTKTIPMDSLGPIPIFSDLKKYLIEETACTGLYPHKSFFPHFHTLMVADNGEYVAPPSRGLPEVQLLLRGLLFTFGRLLAQAVAKHGPQVLGSVLPEPECAQSIMTDGNRFSFLWYQLNTLDMSDLENGVKNIVCIQQPGQMFGTIEEERKNTYRLTEVNEDVLKMYLSMLLVSS